MVSLVVFNEKFLHHKGREQLNGFFSRFFISKTSAMDIEKFLEMFKDEELDTRKLLRAYLCRHVKNKTQNSVQQPKVLEIRKLAWEVAVDIGDHVLLKHMIHTHHLNIDFFPPLFEHGHKELIQFFVAKFSGDKMELLYQALDTSQTSTLAWTGLWRQLKPRKTHDWISVASRSIERIARSTETVHLYDVLIAKFGREIVETLINKHPLAAEMAAFSDAESFVWIWTKTRKKPLKGTVSLEQSSRLALTTLGLAACNPRSFDNLKFLLETACHNDIYAEVWFSPRHLESLLACLFSSQITLCWQEKFRRFCMIYTTVQASKLPCCKNCLVAHNDGVHIKASYILTTKMDSKEQVRQALGWIQATGEKVSWEHIVPIKPFLIKYPELLFDLIPLTVDDPEVPTRKLIKMWGMVAPFSGCVSHPVFLQLVNTFGTDIKWWRGILTPMINLGDGERCPCCKKSSVACFDTRLVWWIGRGMSVEKALSMANKIGLSEKLTKRISMIAAPVVSKKAMNNRQAVLKEIRQ
jgi:hypothetical protein